MKNYEMKNIEELGLEWIIKYKKLKPAELIKGLKNKNIESIIGYNIIGAIKSYRIDMELRLDETKGKIIIHYPSDDSDDSFPSVTTEESYKEFLGLHENFLFTIEKIKFINGEVFIGKVIE